MHVHILGICGTFMAGIAVLAKQLGYKVTGADAAAYPPMSTQLAEQGIECCLGYDIQHLSPMPDLVIVGNAITRGNPEMEYVLNQRIPFISAPEWLFDHVLQQRTVIAVAGTHGKTTTTSMVAWILTAAGIETGFLIGGVPSNFGYSTRLGSAPLFVIEADEYDTAFFDKRSKFLHYRPQILVINNLEFDHADIFTDLAAIQKQFHHLVRAMPNQGLIVHSTQTAVQQVLQKECWTPCQTVDLQTGEWRAVLADEAGSQFAIYYRDELQANITWQLVGLHNVHNALAAFAVARHLGIANETIAQALTQFQSVKRRLEVRGVVNNITVYDDFAHHPTAIQTTLAGLRHKVGKQRIIAVVDPRSNTMKMGVFKEEFAPALQTAEVVLVFNHTQLKWSLADALQPLATAKLFDTTAELLSYLYQIVRSGDHVLMMSNGSFENLHQRLLDALSQS